MSFTVPPSSRSQVRKAGKSIAEKQASDTDYDLVDQWRAAHGYVLNTFKVWLRNHIQISKIEAEFAQRLKRRNTVIDKLQRTRPDGTPLIHDVTSMQDFAGCRLIFRNLEDLKNFRSHLLSSKVMDNVLHKLKHSDRNKYNYIERPKATGYRGIHDVFLHHPRPHRSGYTPSAAWQGLMVEVQYRTRAQHAWATALEISDIMDRQRTKFGHGEDERGAFFAMASEIIAREHENISRAFQEITTAELKRKFWRAESKLNILDRLRALRQFDSYARLGQHNVLNIQLSDDLDYELKVEVFTNSQEAIARANQLEESGTSLNAVYVTGEPKQLRSAYRNYFNDPVDFVGLITH